MSRGLGAIAAILGGAVSLGVASYVLVVDFPDGIIVLGCIAAALAMARYGLLRHGARRIAAGVCAAILIGATAAVMASNRNGFALALVTASFVAALAVPASLSVQVVHCLRRRGRFTRFSSSTPVRAMVGRRAVA